MDKLTNWPSYPHHNGDQPELFAEQIFQPKLISLLVLIGCHLVAIILITIAVAITIAITNIIILIISSNFQPPRQLLLLLLVSQSAAQTRARNSVSSRFSWQQPPPGRSTLFAWRGQTKRKIHNRSFFFTQNIERQYLNNCTCF